MNREEPYREQAERLKQRIQKVNENIDVKDELPPRELVHREKKKKVKWKIKYPVIRILVLFFILLPVIIFSVISYLDGKQINGSKKASTDPVGYETINLKKSTSEEADKVEEEQSVNADGVEATNNPESVEAGTSLTPPAEEQPTANTEKNVSTESPVSPQGAASNNAPVQTQNQPSQTDTSKSEPVQQKIIRHKVQQKETLFSISMKYYKSQKGMDIIKKANNMSNDEIYVGQVLKIPISN
ncbi:LysM peptidoglycan-binding domain-containing protein [Bacillus sp. FJAT-29953]|nr:LysM peptidoglycan-binding domain-containing protein [Bacillus sp. FJAT-29953]